MNIIESPLKDCYIIEPKIWVDERGYFFESFREDKFQEFIGKIDFVQENESLSQKGVFRGLHYQLPPSAQSKLVRVISGRVLDIAVDIRKNSPNFGKHYTIELSEENKKQFFIPQGFAHGFLVLSETAIFSYKVDNYYSKQNDRGIQFNDPMIGLDLHFPYSELILSEKDKGLPLLKDAEVFDV